MSTMIECPRIEDVRTMKGATAKRCSKCRLGVWVSADGMARKYQDQKAKIICTPCATKETAS